MSPFRHAAASIVFAGGTYAATRSLTLAAVTLATGVFLDIDHIPEYLLLHDRSLNPRRFLDSEMHLSSKHSFLFFHGFDLITLVFFIFYSAGFRQAAWAGYIGAVQHLVFDTLINPVKSPFTYFLFFKISKRFRTEKLYFRKSVRL